MPLVLGRCEGVLYWRYEVSNWFVGFVVYLFLVCCVLGCLCLVCCVFYFLDVVVCSVYASWFFSIRLG